MAKAVEINKRQIRERSTVRQVTKHVLLTVGLGVTGVSAAHTGAENLPVIEQKMGQNNAILDKLQASSHSASFSEETRNIGKRRFPVGVRPPIMMDVERITREAQELVRNKDKNTPIVTELEEAVAVTPRIGKVPGDTTDFQKKIANAASQFQSEQDALNDRRNRNLLAKFGGILTAVSYPLLLVGRWGLEKRKKKDNASATTEIANPPTDFPEEPVDVDMPGWMANDLARKGKLLSN